MLDILSSLGSLVAAVIVIVFVTFSFVLPWLIFSAVRNLRLIRMQFERLNESLDARASESRSGPFGH